MWRLEDLGQIGDILLDIQARWETLRTEAERLMSSHHWTGKAALWTRGEKDLEDAGRWQQLVVAGFGFPAPPSFVCDSAPVLCSLSAQLYQAEWSILIGPDINIKTLLNEPKENLVPYHRFKIVVVFFGCRPAH